MIHTPCIPNSEYSGSADSADIRLNYSAAEEPGKKYGTTDEYGFSLVETLMASVILLVISLAVFGALNGIQQRARYQSEVQAVLDNTRNALQAMERCIRQAGNDPHQKGFEAISIINPTEVRIRSDITGSAGKNKGDPDGDINDSGENLLIRYNSKKKRLEMVSRNGPAQIIAENISDLSLQYFDRAGNPTGTGRLVRIITITISGSGTCEDPRTGALYGVKMENTIRVRT
ncbi:MAG: hypothetical protein JXR49_13845 [Acidobacteria bacterium]|nr:hypothetical protein [Acidobacteriota bacterium]